MKNVPPVLNDILCLFALVVGFQLDATKAAEPSRMVFVRHGQTFSNASGSGSTVPGDIHSLNELGQQQAEALVEALQGHVFTAIAVSPMDRAIATMLPYLRSTRQSAEVWPELAECCYQKERDDPPVGIEPQRAFKAPEFAQDVLSIPHDNPPRWLRSDTYQDGLEQIQQAAKRIDSFLAKPGTTLLVVGHSLMGGRLIELLATGEIQGNLHLENGKVTILRRDFSGHYLIEQLNGTDFVYLQSNDNPP